MISPLVWLWVVVLAVNLYFVRWVWTGLRNLAGNPTPENSQKFDYSIIVAAHNEEAHLGGCLESLLDQDYPVRRYEVILVADRCSDRTVPIALEFQKQFPNLRILQVEQSPQGISPKKHALQRGIEAARFERLLFLDADVTVHQQHLSAMNRCFTTDAAAVVSLVKFRPGKHWLHPFLLFEKLITWSISGAGIGRRHPVLSFGGNWGFTRAAFRAAGGYSRIRRSLSGDDDLLIQQMGSQRLPIRFCLRPEAWAWSHFPGSFREFVRQRRRHLSAGKHFKPSIQWGYFLYHSSNLLLWAGGMVNPVLWSFLLLKLLVDFRVLAASGKIFRQPVDRLLFPLWEFGYLIYNTLLGPLSYLGKIRW